MLYLSLLEKLKAVLETKDSELINFPITIACLMNATVWCIYSILVKNAYLFIPNVLGIFCAILQMVLYLWAIEVIPDSSPLVAPLLIMVERKKVVDFAKKVDEDVGGKDDEDLEDGQIIKKEGVRLRGSQSKKESSF